MLVRKLENINFFDNWDFLTLKSAVELYFLEMQSSDNVADNLRTLLLSFYDGI